MIKLRRIGHATFETPDLQKMIDYYTEVMGLVLAEREKIALTDEHWDVIRFMRRYWEEHQLTPDARFVIRHIMERRGPGARNRLFELFPYGYPGQACRIAGMKRPRAWSTG